jgi:O-antigen ligase
MYPVLLALIILLFAALTWRDVRTGIFLLFASLPSYLLRFELFGVPMTLLEALLLACAVIWAMRQLRARADVRFLGPWTIPLLLFLIAGTLSVFVSLDQTAALGVWKAYILEPILFFVLVRSTLTYPRDVDTMLFALGVSAVFISAFAIFQVATGLALPIPWDVERRATSVFPYPNAVGLYLGPIIMLGITALYRAVREQMNMRAWFWLITVVLSVVAITLSETEAAWFAVPAAALVAGLFVPRLRILALPILALSVVIVLATPSLRDKVMLQDYSGQVRIKQWSETIEMLKDNPVFGAGLSGYPIALAPYHTHEEIEIFQYPHNIVLNIWTELGLLGLIAFLALAIRVAYECHVSYCVMRSPFFWLTFGCFAALLEMVIHGLVDVPYFKNDLAMMTFGILALLSWSARYAPRQTPDA